MAIYRAVDLVSSSAESPTLREPVYFVAQELRRTWPELSHPDAVQEIRLVDPARLHVLENIWVVSTYLRLKTAGLNVKIVDHLVPGAINICTAEGLIYSSGSHRAFIVAVQADRGRLGWGDYTLVQSPTQASRARTCLIDHWPQPGLRPRELTRGNQIRRVGYLGYAESLAGAFRQDSFRKELANLGVDWVLRERPADWNNYSDLDLCLAVRDISEVWIRTKPPTKLFHAWLTGCPALLGREPAFRYWGEPGIDYFEVTNPAEARIVIQRLQSDPALYRSIQQRGLLKGPAHDEQAVLRQWVATITGPIDQAFQHWQTDHCGSLVVRAVARRAERIVAPLRRHFFYVRVGGLKRISRRLRRAFTRTR